jgi:hypothetical protein
MTDQSGDSLLRKYVHDLNNDLSAAIAYADFLDLDIAPDHKAYQTVQKLIKSIDAAQKTTAAMRAHYLGKTD